MSLYSSLSSSPDEAITELRKVSLFEQLDDADLRKSAAQMRRREYGNSRGSRKRRRRGGRSSKGSSSRKRPAAFPETRRPMQGRSAQSRRGSLEWPQRLGRKGMPPEPHGTSSRQGMPTAPGSSASFRGPGRSTRREWMRHPKRFGAGTAPSSMNTSVTSAKSSGASRGLSNRTPAATPGNCRQRRSACRTIGRSTSS